MSKKGDMGVGVLILFIAMLLTAAIVAGVLIQTSSSLQQKSIETGDSAQGQIATTGRITEISATDGSTGNLTDFRMILRLVSGSAPIRLDDLLLTMDLYDSHASLKYKDGPSEKSNEGYNTWREQELGEMGVGYDKESSVIVSTGWTTLDMDFDLDGIDDQAIVCDNLQLPVNPCPDAADRGKYIYINLSEDADFKLPIYNATGFADVCTNSGEPYTTSAVDVGEDGKYGFVRYIGTVRGGCNIRANNATFYHGAILNEDFDDDSLDDLFYIKDSGNVTLELSSGKSYDFDLGVNLGTGAQNLDLNIDMTSGNTDFGNIILKGDTSQADYIDENVTFSIVPKKFGEGYFTISYEQKGTNWRDGIFSQGDMITVYFESPKNIGEDEEVRIRLLPKTGLATFADFYTPSTLSNTQEHLYP